MKDEKRRYFRIDDTIGIAYHILADEAPGPLSHHDASDVMALVSEQDQRLQSLLLEVAEESPKVAELVAIFNQKLERVVNQLMLENHMVGRLACRVKEANISACGIGFSNEEAVPSGTRLQLELSLFPGERKIITHGIVVACDQQKENTWYWRVDFYGMSDNHQEALIQHVVQSQSSQIRKYT